MIILSLEIYSFQRAIRILYMGSLSLLLRDEDAHATTGKKFKVHCMNFFQIKNSQFVSDTGCPDIFGMLMQIGLLPV